MVRANQLEVRRAELRDAAIVAWVVRTSFKEYRKGRREPLSAQLNARKVKRQMVHGKTQYAIAWIEGKAVGVIAFKRKGNALVFGPVGVIPRLRARGIGAALLRWVEARAAASKCLTVMAEVLWGLKPLVRYYRRRGYRIRRNRRGRTIAIKRIKGRLDCSR